MYSLSSSSLVKPCRARHVVLSLVLLCLKSCDLRPVENNTVELHEDNLLLQKHSSNRVRRNIPDFDAVNPAFLDQDSLPDQDYSADLRQLESQLRVSDRVNSLVRGHKSSKVLGQPHGKERFAKIDRIDDAGLSSDEQYECYRQQNIDPPIVREFSANRRLRPRKGRAKDHSIVNERELQPGESMDYFGPELHPSYVRSEILKERGGRRYEPKNNTIEVHSFYSNPEEETNEKIAKKKPLSKLPSEYFLLKDRKVPKPVHEQAEFPVYDDDIDLQQDPLQGILDEKYWLDPEDQPIITKTYVDEVRNHKEPSIIANYGKRSISDSYDTNRKDSPSIESLKGANSPRKEIESCNECSKGKSANKTDSSEKGEDIVKISRKLLSVFDDSYYYDENPYSDEDIFAEINHFANNDDVPNMIKEIEPADYDDEFRNNALRNEGQLSDDYSDSLKLKSFRRKLLVYEGDDDFHSRDYVQLKQQERRHLLWYGNNENDAEELDEYYDEPNVYAFAQESDESNLPREQERDDRNGGNYYVNEDYKYGSLQPGSNIIETPFHKKNFHTRMQNNSLIVRRTSEPSRKILVGTKIIQNDSVIAQNSRVSLPLKTEIRSLGVDNNNDDNKYNKQLMYSSKHVVNPQKDPSSHSFQVLKNFDDSTKFEENNMQNKPPNYYLSDKIGELLQSSDKNKHSKNFNKTRIDYDKEFEIVRNETYKNATMGFTTSPPDRRVKSIHKRGNIGMNSKRSYPDMDIARVKPEFNFGEIRSLKSLEEMAGSNQYNKSQCSTTLQVSSTLKNVTIKKSPTTMSPNVTSKTSTVSNTFQEDQLDSKVANDIVESVIAESRRGSVSGHNLGVCRMNESSMDIKFGKIVPETERVMKTVTNCLMDKIKDHLAKQSCILLDEELLDFLKWLVLGGESYKDYMMKAGTQFFAFVPTTTEPPTTCGGPTTVNCDQPGDPLPPNPGIVPQDLKGSLLFE